MCTVERFEYRYISSTLIFSFLALSTRILKTRLLRLLNVIQSTFSEPSTIRHEFSRIRFLSRSLRLNAVRAAQNSRMSDIWSLVNEAAKFTKMVIPITGSGRRALLLG